jgi:CBS domain-containing protein
MEVRQLVGGSTQMCDPTTSMGAAAAVMISEGVGSLGVSGREGLAGIVTERDVLRAVAPADMSVDDAAVWMVAAGYRHLPVMDGTALLGVASIKDVLWAITEQHLNEDANSAD